MIAKFRKFDSTTHFVAVCSSMLQSGAKWCIISPLRYKILKWATKKRLRQQPGNKDKLISDNGQQKRIE